MESLITWFPKYDQKILKNALLHFKGNVELATNYILDFYPQNNDKELDAVQGMLHLSTTGQSTLINSIDIIDLSNVPEATAHTSTNAASFTTIAMTQTFHSDHWVVSNTSEEGSVKTHLSDDEMKALVDNQNNDQLSKAKNHPTTNYVKNKKMKKR